MKITYLNKREGEKWFRLTLNHPSLMDEGEEIKVSTDGSQRGEEKKENSKY